MGRTQQLQLPAGQYQPREARRNRYDCPDHDVQTLPSATHHTSAIGSGYGVGGRTRPGWVLQQPVCTRQRAQVGGCSGPDVCMPDPQDGQRAGQDHSQESCPDDNEQARRAILTQVGTANLHATRTVPTPPGWPRVDARPRPNTAWPREQRSNPTRSNPTRSNPARSHPAQMSPAKEPAPRRVPQHGLPVQRLSPLPARQFPPSRAGGQGAHGSTAATAWARNV